MSKVVAVRSRALAGVCRLVTAAERHEQETISVAELRAVLADVDVDGLASPRPMAVVRNVGRPMTVSEMRFLT